MSRENLSIQITSETTQFQAAIQAIEKSLLGMKAQGVTAGQAMALLGATSEEARVALGRFMSGGIGVQGVMQDIGLGAAAQLDKLREISAETLTAADALATINAQKYMGKELDREFAQAQDRLKKYQEEEIARLARVAEENERTANSKGKNKKATEALADALRRVGPEGIKLNAQGKFDDPRLEEVRQDRENFGTFNKVLKTNTEDLEKNIKTVKLWGMEWKVNTRGFKAGVRGASRAAGTAIRGIGSMLSAINPAAGAGMAFMTSSLTTLIAILGGAAAGVAFKWFKDFDTALRGINVLIPKSQRNFEALGDQVKRLAMLSGSDIFDMAKSFELAVSTDVKVGELETFMNVATKLAIVGQTSTENSVKLLTTLKNTFQLTMDEIEAAGDIAFATVDKSTATIEQLSLSVGSFSAEARASGANVIEMMSLFSALTLQSGNVQRAGMELRNFFMMFNKMSEKSAKALKQFGLESIVTKQAIQSNGLMWVLDKMVEAFEKNDKLLPLVAEDMRKFAAATKVVEGGLKVAQKNVDEFTDSTGALTEAVNEFEEGAGQKWNKLMQAGKVGAIEWGESLAGALEHIMKLDGRMDVAQKKILRGMMSVQLWVQSFILVAQSIPAAFIILWEKWIAFKEQLAAHFMIAMKSLFGKFVLLAKEFVDEVNKLYKTETGEKWAKSLGETLKKTNEEVRQGHEDIQKSWERLQTRIAEDPMGMLGNIDSIRQLEQDVGNLGDEIKMMQDEAERGWGRVGKSVEDALGSGARDPAEYEAEVRLNREKQLAATVAEGLKDQVKLAKKTSSSKISLLKKEMSEAKRIHEQAVKEYQDLEEDRRKFNEDITDRIWQLNMSMSTSGKRKKMVREMAVLYEEFANDAARSADIPLALEQLGKSMNFWEQMLQFNDSKGSKRKIIGVLRRLQGEANELIDRGQATEVARAADADAKLADAQAKIVTLEKLTADFVSSVKVAVDYWTSLTVKTQEVVTQALAFFSDALKKQEILLGLNTDPAMQDLRNMQSLLSGTVMGPAPKMIMNDRPVQSNPGEGSINYGGVTLYVNIDGQSRADWPVDTRQLAKQIGREVRRGQSSMTDSPTQR